MRHFLAVFSLLFLVPGAFAAAPVNDGKIVVAVLNLRNTSGVSEGEAELLSDRLRIDMFNTGKFAVMERAQMQDILKEQGFQQSGTCTDEGCMVEIGQLLGVKFLIAGSIGKLGSLFLVNVRSINVATGKIAKVVAEDIKGDLEDVVTALPRISARLSSDGNSMPSAAATESRDNEEDTNDDNNQAEESPREDGPLPEAPVYLETFVFTAANSFIQANPDEFADLTEDINDDLLDAFNEMFDDKAVLVSRNQLAGLTNPGTLVIRLVFNGYSTKPEINNQFAGTADVAFEFFEGPAAKPSFRLNVIKTGSRHWGQTTPLANAFDAVAEEIEDNLDDVNWVKDAWKKVDNE